MAGRANTMSTERKIPTGEMIQRHIHGRQLPAFTEEFQKESDRAAAVLAAAYLDDELALLLRSSLAGGTRVVENLLGRDRPLSSFSARTSSSFAFGLISKDEYHDLDLIRRIRNIFAHQKHGINFEYDENLARWRANLGAWARGCPTGLFCLEMTKYA